MAWNVSETFRANCYDQSKRQRMLLQSDEVCLTNEDISVNGMVKFNLASITGDQVVFGQTPTNSINVSILNEDGRITAEEIASDEFRCYIGVEVSDDDFYCPANAICAIHTKNESISVHSVAPYVRGNVQFESLLPQLSNGWKCKILFAYEVVYFVVDNGTNRYYGKNERNWYFDFGENEECTTLEKNMLDRFMDKDDDNDSISYHEGGMAEYAFIESKPPVNSWNDLSSGTWNTVRSKDWADYSGYTQMAHVEYESVPYGVWKFEKPRTVNLAMLNINGKDRMTAFDEDSLGFAEWVGGTSMTVRNFIKNVAAYKGIPIGDLSGLGDMADEIKIDPSRYYQGKSLKDLLSYAFEVGASNAIIDREGNLSAHSTSMIAPELPYVYSFDVADFTACTIGSVLIYKQGDLRLYQAISGVSDGDTYEWNDNPFFNKTSPASQWDSEGMHSKFGGFRNAITVADADYSLWCDDCYRFTQEETTFFEPIFTISMEWNASGRVTYTNNGQEKRKYAKYDKRIEATTSINDNNMDGLNKAQYANKLEFNEEGLTVFAKGMQIRNVKGEKVFYADDNGDLVLSGTLSAVKGYFSGLLSATSGSIGGFEIVSDNLRCTNPNDAGENLFLGMGYGANPMDKTPLLKVSSTVGVDEIGATNYKHIAICKDGIYFQTSKNTSQYASSVGGAFATGALGEEYLDVFASRRLNLRSSSGVVRIESYQPIECNKTVSFGNVPSSASSANAVLTYADSKYTLNVQSSLRKFKDNIETIADASEKVDNLRGVQFTSKCEADDPNTVYFGLIAEEVEKVVPELATYVNGELQSVQYDRVCALLIEDNKACHKRIKDLEDRLEKLERMVNK